MIKMQQTLRKNEVFAGFIKGLDTTGQYMNPFVFMSVSFTQNIYSSHELQTCQFRLGRLHTPHLAGCTLHKGKCPAVRPGRHTQSGTWTSRRRFPPAHCRLRQQNCNLNLHHRPATAVGETFVFCWSRCMDAQKGGGGGVLWDAVCMDVSLLTWTAVSLETLLEITAKAQAICYFV